LATVRPAIIVVCFSEFAHRRRQPLRSRFPTGAWKAAVSDQLLHSRSRLRGDLADLRNS
jgi:hypothetical protein